MNINNISIIVEFLLITNLLNNLHCYQKFPEILVCVGFVQVMRGRMHRGKPYPAEALILQPKTEHSGWGFLENSNTTNKNMTDYNFFAAIYYAHRLQIR